MKSRGKTILTALLVAGGLAGLLAVIAVLPGRWDRGGPAQAHILAGVEIIDTQASCQSSAHILNGANPTIAHATTNAGVTERQTITMGGTVTGGTFTLTFSGQTTAAIAFDATAGAVATALELLSNITDVTGGGGALPGTAVTVDFINPAGDVAQMTVKNNLTGTSPTVSVATTTAGVDEVQTVTLANAVAGTFTLTFSGQTTAAIAFNAANATVESALEALSNITGLAVTGGPLPGSALTVTFGIPGGNVAELTSDTSLLIGDCTSANANADAIPSHFLQDTDGDTIVDAIVVPSGTVVQLVAHVHDGTADVANGTAVTFTATGSNAFFRSWSREADDGLDGTDGNTADNGLLFDGPDAQTVEAETVGDRVLTTACDAANDTCIDGAGDAAADGIAIAQVSSGVPTSSTITVQSTTGTDTVTVIWTGAATTVTVTATNLAKTAAQTIIAQAGLAGGEKPANLNGDPDLTITAEIRDSAGNLVPADANVDCAILAAAELTRADLLDALVANNGVIGVGADAVNDSADETTGVKQFSLESQAGNTRGDVTVTCWSNTVNADNTLDANEPFGTVTIRVSGPPATVDLQGNATMGVGTQALKAVVTDGDGEPVANATNCVWLLIDPQLIAGLASPVSGGTAGTTANSGSNTLVAAAAGAVSVSVTCGTANDLLSITISGVAPPVFPPGDLNCDNSFTVADLLAGARALVGLDPDLVAC